MQSSEAVYEQAVLKRYIDAYRVARFTTGAGSLIKISGGVLAVVIGLGTLFVAGQYRNSTEQMVFFFIGVISAVFAGGLLFLFGVLVAAQGEVLKAILDTAVNASPFLTNKQRAEIMSLRGSSQTHKIQVDAQQ
jgi:hypothetical protein